jgi:hypothetical protein
MVSIAATAFSCMFGRTWLQVSKVVEIEECPIKFRTGRDASKQGGAPRRRLPMFAEGPTGGGEEAYFVEGLKRSV